MIWDQVRKLRGGGVMLKVRGGHYSVLSVIHGSPVYTESVYSNSDALLSLLI